MLNKRSSFLFLGDGDLPSTRGGILFTQISSGYVA